MSDRPSLYVHGTSPKEQERLRLLNILVNPSSLELMNPQPGDRVLDVASGLAEFSRQIARRTGVPVVGIERSPEQIAHARALADEAGESGRIDLREGTAEAFPLRDNEWGSFDLVHGRFILEHVPDPLAVVRQMVRAARPGGRLILEDDDHDVMRLFPEPAGWAAVWDAYMRSYEVLGADPRVGRRLPDLLVQAGAAPCRNTWKFYGGCTGDEHFKPFLVNLVEVIETAREIMVGQLGLDEAILAKTLQEVCALSDRPGAALWYGMCWVEGRRN